MLFRAWDKVVDILLSLLQVIQAEFDRRRGSRKPNRWRLRRLYRYQQRHPTKGPRETYDDLIRT